MPCAFITSRPHDGVIHFLVGVENPRAKIVFHFGDDLGRTQAEAARHCGITQPRMNDLLPWPRVRFSIDALVNIATSIGRRVHMELETA